MNTNYFKSITRINRRRLFRIFILSAVTIFLLGLSTDLFNYNPESVVSLPNHLPHGSTADKTIKIHLVDLENNNIVNASVYLKNLNAPLQAFNRISDANGNVTFAGIENSSAWKIVVNFSVGVPIHNFTIKEITHSINLPPGSTDFLSLTCNLTTVNLTIRDSNINNPAYWGMYNARLILQKFGLNENLTSFYSDLEGKVSLKIPIDSYNTQIQYQGQMRQFLYHGSNDPTYLIAHNLSITTVTTYFVNVSVSEIKSELKILKTELNHPDWASFSQINTVPYEIGIYHGEAFKLILKWREVFSQDDITLPSGQTIWNVWDLTRSGLIVNSSQASPNAIQKIIDQDGNYSLFIDSTNLYSGTYHLLIQFNQTGYQDAIIFLTVNIWNWTTSLSQVLPSGQIDLTWNTTLTLILNYTAQIPVIQNISSAVLQYSIEDQDFSGNLVLYQINTGLYILDQVISIPTGTYDLIIQGNATNYAYNSIIIVVQVLSAPCNLTLTISQPEFQVTTNYLRAAHGENVTFLINYAMWPSQTGLEDANIIVKFGEIVQSPLLLIALSPGLWRFSVAADQFIVNTYTVEVTAIQSNYEPQSAFLTVQIIANWSAQISPRQPPTEYNWGDNVSFIIKYTCSETPRKNLALSNAIIDRLRIITKVNLVEYPQHTFSLSELNVLWGWQNLKNNPIYGSGFYLVWFNTTSLNLTMSMTMYAIPQLSQSYYKPVEYSLNFRLNPLNIQMELYSQDHIGTPIASMIFDQNDSLDLIAHLKVDELGNIYHQKLISDAVIIYTIKNLTDNSNLEVGEFDPLGMGQYNLSFTLGSLGVFVLVLDMIYLNHTAESIEFYYNVTGTVNVSVYIHPLYFISNSSLKVAFGENFTFYITLSESNPSSITLIVLVDQSPIPISWIYELTPGYFFCTTPGSTYTVGQHSITIIASKSQFVTTQLTLILTVVSEWRSLTILENPPENAPWGRNVSFVIQFLGGELMRSGVPITGASITQLTLTTHNSAMILESGTLGLLWGYRELIADPDYGPGYYLIWFNSSIITLNENQLVAYIKPSITSPSYKLGQITIPALILAIATDLSILTSSNGNDFSFLVLKTGQTVTIYAKYNVTEVLSSHYGQNITLASINLSLYYTNGTLYQHLSFDESQPGLYSIQLIANNLIFNEYLAEIRAHLMNYTIQDFQFTFIIGQTETQFSVNIPIYSKISDDALKVAKGENITFTLIINDAIGISTSVWLYLDGDLVSGAYSLGNGNYLCNISIATMEPGTYLLRIVGLKIGNIPSEKVLSIVIIDVWATQINVFEPPLMYPWGNLIVFNVSYFCIETPRLNQYLAGATFTSLNIIKFSSGHQQSIWNLTAADLNIKWGWSSLSSKGPGYYSIWFDSQYVNVSLMESFYLIPKINLFTYSSPRAQPTPYCWVSPITTDLTLIDPIDQTKELENIVIYLDQVQEITIRYFVSDTKSIYFDQYLTSASIWYYIYRKSDNSLVDSGQIIWRRNRGFIFDLSIIDLGNYTVEIRASQPNFISVSQNFSVHVPKKTITPQFSENVHNGVSSAPQNLAYSFQFRPIDPITGSPITSANVTAVFMGISYQLNEDPNSPGTYILVIPMKDVQQATIETVYPVTITVEKEKYEPFEFTVQLQIGLPVDPYLQIPYRYWLIILGSFGFAVSVTVTYQVIKYSRIPYILKKIRQLEKLISKHKVVPDTPLVSTLNEEIYRLFSANWTKLNLDIKEIIENNSKGTQELSRYKEQLLKSQQMTEKSLDELQKEVEKQKKKSKGA